MQSMRTIVLASASPRRKELLRSIGITFTTRIAPGEEEFDTSRAPEAMAKALARNKALAVARECQNALIISADTIVIIGGRVLGKPVSRGDAYRMLRLLSGKQHTVITAYTVFDTVTGKHRTKAVSTTVRFRRLSDDMIERYLDTGEPFDKAGSYGIQGVGALLVKEIEGDYFNVMGLPIGYLVETLRGFGVSVL